MNNSYLKIEFFGFKPGHEMKTIVDVIAEKMQLRSPSDSAVSVVMTMGKGVMNASCRIASEAGTFVADAVCENPVHAIKEIERKIGRQLDAWKRRRIL